MLFMEHDEDELYGNFDACNNPQTILKEELYGDDECIFLKNVMAWFVMLQSNMCSEYLDDADFHDVSPTFFNMMPNSEMCKKIVMMIDANRKSIDDYELFMQTKKYITNHYSMPGNENQETYDYSFLGCFCFVNISGE